MPDAAHTDMSVILSAMPADSGLTFDHPEPSNGAVPIFNAKSRFFKQTVPLSHIMKLTPMSTSYQSCLCRLLVYT